ncbi:hypothetical protein H6G80_30320 [Nostoc sp. FACHB-87]|uniref:DUF5895 domain-containing protein n=1 Tax=Nostocaceae TaxID=1162 RepID=UPI00168402B1|nr:MULTISPECIES: DUF5895 domain-containing protein [Nostocaceae]MBD2458350.1 hypothetical protein [Nostoc sp. FACHB-87]MBD2479339.1 hypothetical protein [Anabaena sp. FACHB-83]
MVASTLEFDFDSAQHKAYDKTPAAKSIPSPAGIWIAYDNQQLAGWYEGKELEHGKQFTVLTNKLDENDEKIGIPGVIYRQPRMLVIGRSPLLFGNDRKVIGVWRKDEGLDKNNYKFARRYMVIFVDAQNQPLHIAPIQITAWGVFQVSFDQQLLAFREFCEQTYAEVQQKPHEAKTLLWHSMWVFCPTLKTEKRERGGQASNACVCSGFEKPTALEWEKHCIGRQAQAQEVAVLHNSITEWWKKGIADNSPSNTAPASSRKLDRNSLMIESQKLIEVLGWNQEQGKKFLLEHYGKKGRQLLTDAEFVDFVDKLQSMMPDDEVGCWEDVPY